MTSPIEISRARRIPTYAYNASAQALGGTINDVLVAAMTATGLVVSLGAGGSGPAPVSRPGSISGTDRSTRWRCSRRSGRRSGHRIASP